ncbi:hypothetical protein XENORESO_016910 [Xenotaenia resolanae]|uniref:Uncharacterized protein n=1 Tax=Xenotaenia resolanae TaxID=208358 RepID=A0ABV0WP84_9TELE
MMELKTQFDHSARCQTQFWFRSSTTVSERERDLKNEWTTHGSFYRLSGANQKLRMLMLDGEIRNTCGIIGSDGTPICGNILKVFMNRIIGNFHLILLGYY